MNEVRPTLRPETLALDALIRQRAAQTKGSAAQRPADTLVFLGNRPPSFPRAVVKDPVLEPVDKLVWMVLMLSVHEAGANTAFPGYASIGKRANVSSRSTIARAIAILRATRWLTLCAMVRNDSGRSCGNVYALHDEPLPLADALHLDSNYRVFVRAALSHAHARVRAVAQGVLDAIDEDSRASQAVCVQPHALERRLQRMVVTQDGEPRRFFSFTQNTVRRLRTEATGGQKGGGHHDQNSNTAEDRVRNSNSGPCSSSYINITTTTPVGPPSNFVLTGQDGQPLVYPARLCERHREIADRYLSALAPEQRQPILDELEGRFRAEGKGMKPVYDALSFLCSLCKRMRTGKFQPNLGIEVRDGRRQRKNARPADSSMKFSQPAKTSDAQRRRAVACGKARIAEMRKRLGTPTPTGNQGITGDR